MGDGGAGTEDEGGKGCDGKAGDEAVGANPFDRGIIHLYAAVFRIDGSPAILGGSEGVKRGTFEDGNSFLSEKRVHNAERSDPAVVL